MEKKVSCIYCGHPNAADAMFCHACSRVLDDPGTLDSQVRKVYLDEENALVTEASVFLYGKTYPISEIAEVEITENPKGRRTWGLGLVIFGLGTIIEGLFDKDLSFSFICGLPCIIAGALLAVVSRPKKEEEVYTLWITTGDGTENSLALEDQAEAEAIRDAILQARSEQVREAGT